MHRLPILLAIGAMLLDGSPLAMAQEATPAGATPTADLAPRSRFDDVLQLGIDGGLSGVALYVERGDDVIFDGAAGLANREDAIPLTSAERFRIYSITKAFTATLVLLLVDDGVLSLDDTVTDWLEDPVVRRIPHVDTIALCQLLNHTSGVYDYFDADSPFWQDAYLGEDADWTRVWSPLELLAYAGGDQHAPYFAPGDGEHYSNTGYVLLGLILEEASGQTFADFLHNRILDPLDLGDTVFAATEEVPAGGAEGYQSLDGALVNVSATHLSAQWAEGGMVSTTRDLARFADALFGGELLAPGAMKEMSTFVVSERPGIAWGLGISRLQTPSGTLVGMGGSGPGFVARMFRLPDEDLTVVLLTNTNLDDDTVDTLFAEAVQMALATPAP